MKIAPKKITSREAPAEFLFFCGILQDAPYTIIFNLWYNL